MATLAHEGLEPTEALLWKAYVADRSARPRERLFDFYLPFARLVAARHFRRRRGGDIEFAEFCQSAYAGLLEAIDHFDPDRGVPFKGYAHGRISGSITDAVQRSSEFREQLSFQRRARRERASSLLPEGGPGRTTSDAMAALAELAVGLAIGFMLEDTNLYVAGQDAASKTNAYESLAWKETVQRLAREVDNLDDRDRLIIRYHYFEEMTFDQIGSLLGVTKGRVSQMHRACLALLSKRLRKRSGFLLER